MNNFQISIDGHAACGKSTLAGGLADALGFLYIDSGAMYRGVTLYFLNKGHSFNTQPSDVVVRNIDIEFVHKPNSTNMLLLNGENVSSQLRSKEVNANVSKVAVMSNVRRYLVSLQQNYGRTQNVVMDGRDIGTVVFPDAVLKIFLTADLETRIQRRMNDWQAKGQTPDFETVKQNLIERDHIDSTRADSPLIKASDSVLIDNTNLSIEEQLAMVRLLAIMRMEKEAGN